MKRMPERTIGDRALYRMREEVVLQKIDHQALADKVSKGKPVTTEKVKQVLMRGHEYIDALVEIFYGLRTTASLGLSSIEDEDLQLAFDKMLAYELSVHAKTYGISIGEIGDRALAVGKGRTKKALYYAILQGDCMELNIINAVACEIKPDCSFADIIAACEAEVLANAA